jgi:hypothetical protein
MTTHVDLYIASGRKNGFYTLRVARTSGEFCTDMYLRNLSTDAKTAETKARDYFERVYGGQANVQLNGFADFDLSPWGSLQPWERAQVELVEAGVWPFGKNQGKQISESEDGYIFYWAKQIGSSNVAAMLVEKCKEIAETRGLYNVERHKLAVREAQTATDLANSAYVGTVGERKVFTLTLAYIAGYDSDFGHVTVEAYRDEEGRMVVYKGTAPVGAELGQTVIVKATIKEHSERNGIKQTLISRLHGAKINGVE